jgi:hypothetical protein
MPAPKIRPPHMTVTPTRRIRTNFTAYSPTQGLATPTCHRLSPSVRRRPPAAGGEAADDRCPQGGISTRRPSADCSSTLPHEAGRWHVSGRSGRLQATDDPPARERIVKKVHVRELKTSAVAPECFGSAASGMRRTIAPDLPTRSEVRRRVNGAGPPSRLCRRVPPDGK